MSTRRLLTLSTHSTSPGQRFRIETWAPYLAAHGIETHSHCFATPRLERLLPQRGKSFGKALHAADSYARYLPTSPWPGDFDGVLVYREAMPLGPALWERLVGRFRPMAFDIDDPIFLAGDRSRNPVLSRLRSHSKWKQLCSAAQVTLCINELIAEHVRPYCQRVEVIPNAVDLARYPLRPAPTPGATPVIGYSGSHSTMRQLHVIRAVLEDLEREHRFVLRVVGGPAPFLLQRSEVQARTWSESAELSLLQGFDIGVAPAPDDEWNRYKHFVKVILYMAVGVPVVASRVGSPTRFLRDGVNGFLAGSTEEWAEKLRLLLGDPGLRERMGAAGRETIEREFALSRQLPRVLKIFSDLTGGARVRRAERKEVPPTV